MNTNAVSGLPERLAEPDRWTEVERQSCVALKAFKNGHEIAKETYDLEIVLKHVGPVRRALIEQKFSKVQVLQALKKVNFGLKHNHALFNNKRLSPARRLELLAVYEKQLNSLSSNGNYYAEVLRMVGYSWFYSSKVKTK